MDSKIKRKLKIGIILDGLLVPAWIDLIINNINDSSRLELVLLLLTKNPEIPNYKAIVNFLLKMEQKFIKIKYDALKEIPLENYSFIPQMMFDNQTSNNKVVEKGTELNKIQSYGINLFLDFTNSKIGRSFSPAASFGVWTLNFLEGYIAKGLPIGFSEILCKKNSKQIIFKNGDNNFYKKNFKTCTQVYPYSIIKNRNRILWKSTALVNNALLKISEGIAGDIKNLDYSDENQVSYLSIFRHLSIVLRHWLYNLFYQEQWILLYKKNNVINYEFATFKKIMPPKDRFWADPHVIYKDKTHYVFFEELIFKERKAHISYLSIDENNKISNSHIILKKEHHLSYPFIFEWQNELFMIPETSKNKTVEIYICTEFPSKWKFYKYLMKDIDAGDVTLFFHNNKWWLFANIALNDGYPNWDDLYLFYADDPLNDNWIAHPCNPIVSDVSRSRPAGKIFKQNDLIYRPSQDSSKRYGFAININQITKLNEKEYSEYLINKLEPNWDHKINRVHTLNYDSNLTIIDAKRKMLKYF